MLVFDGRDHDLGGGLLVKRILPYRQKRMVGPFAFLDYMAPATFKADQNTDVRPHPHIGLSTLTYLLEGRNHHRDSIGSSAIIEPGDIGWMTAGKGIAHSERTPVADRSQGHKMHGLQFWVALPDGQEEVEPSFQHYPQKDIPQLENEDYKMTVAVGEAFGIKSPVKTTSPTVLVEFLIKRDCDIKFNFGSYEIAALNLKGIFKLAEQEIKNYQLAVVDSGENTIQAQAGSHFFVFGGEVFVTPRHIWWNLVSSSLERIEAAKAAWKDRSFPQVVGDDEYIPLPEK